MPSTLTIRWRVSGGPIEVASLKALKTAGHIIGLNGNWAVAVGALPEWHYLFSFIGPMEMSKHAFLNQLKAYVPAADYVMVGNILGVSGASDDQGAALLAGWRYQGERVRGGKALERSRGSAIQEQCASANPTKLEHLREGGETEAAGTRGRTIAQRRAEQNITSGGVGIGMGLAIKARCIARGWRLIDPAISK